MLPSHYAINDGDDRDTDENQKLVPKATNVQLAAKLKYSMFQKTNPLYSFPNLILILFLIIGGAVIALIALRSMYDYGKDGAKALGIEDEGTQNVIGSVAYGAAASLSSLGIQVLVPTWLKGLRDVFREERYRDKDFYPWFLIRFFSFITIFMPAAISSADASFKVISSPVNTNVALGSSVSTNSTFSWKLLPENLFLPVKEEAKLLNTLIQYFSQNLSQFFNGNDDLIDLIDFFVVYRDAKTIEQRTKVVMDVIFSKIGEEVVTQLIAKHPCLGQHLNANTAKKGLYLAVALWCVMGVALTWDAIGSGVKSDLYEQFPPFLRDALKLYGGKWDGVASMLANSFLTLFTGLKVVPTIAENLSSIPQAFKTSKLKGLFSLFVTVLVGSGAVVYGISQYGLSTDNPISGNKILNETQAISMGTGAAAQAAYGFFGLSKKFSGLASDIAWYKVLRQGEEEMKKYRSFNQNALRAVILEKLQPALSVLGEEIKSKSANARVGGEITEALWGKLTQDQQEMLLPSNTFSSGV